MDDDQETLIYLNEEDVQEGVDLCKKNLVGKILSDKSIHKASIMTTLDNIWCNPKGLRIEEIKGKLFHSIVLFFFCNFRFWICVFFGLILDLCNFIFCMVLIFGFV